MEPVVPQEDLRCAFCNSADLFEIIDFGHVALAGAFLTPAQFAQERRFPMRLEFCRDCYAVQIVDKVPPEILFKDYFYFSSSIGTLRNHFQVYAQQITERFLDPASATVLEIGCNDGVLVRPLADQGIATVIGVDPATNVVSTIADPRVTVINDFFNEASAAAIVERHGKIDVIMANNVYAHIEDIQGTTRAIASSLKDDGVFVFEVHYLGKLIDEMQYDMIYHEHIYYYSLLSAINHFARYDMVVFDVMPVPIHAGSMRFYVAKAGSRHAREKTDAVRELETRERADGFDTAERFLRYADAVAATRTDLMALLADLKEKGHRIAGYGASGRANTVIQYCGIGTDQLDYMIDDAPAKQGFFTPGSHLEIFPSSILTSDRRPDYLLVFAWSFLEEIRRRNEAYFSSGGHAIVPLPTVEIVD